MTSDDIDKTGLQGMLDIEKPKTTSLQILTSSHITQISSNDTDITALQGRLNKEEQKNNCFTNTDFKSYRWYGFKYCKYFNQASNHYFFNWFRM